MENQNTGRGSRSGLPMVGIWRHNLLGMERIAGGISAGKSKGMGKQAYRGPDLRISQLRNPATSVACRLNQQAGLRPTTGLCPVPRGGSAPATGKTFL